MIIEVIQSCDWCGTKDSSKGMHVPSGWIMVDLRGGLEPGLAGYGWNVCGFECLYELVEDMKAGKNPLPYGMSEQSQVIQEEAKPQRRRPDDASLIAQASAHMNGRRREVPVEQQGHGGH